MSPHCIVSLSLLIEVLAAHWLLHVRGTCGAAVALRLTVTNFPLLSLFSYPFTGCHLYGGRKYGTYILFLVRGVTCW